MSVALVKYGQEQIDLLKRTLVSGKDPLSNDEFAMFLEICKRTGLDPFRKQIYAVKRGGRMVVQTGIDGYRVLAERSGKYAGQVGAFWCGEDGNWLDMWIDSKPPRAAKVGVLRTDFKEPCWGVARFDSYRGDNLWNKMPEVMLAKCAEALAIRRAFPDEVGSIYTKEEMDQADVQQAASMQTVDAIDVPSLPEPTAGPDYSALLEKAANLDELKAVAKDINEASKAGRLQPDVRKALADKYKSRTAELNGAAA